MGVFVSVFQKNISGVRRAKTDYMSWLKTTVELHAKTHFNRYIISCDPVVKKELFLTDATVANMTAITCVDRFLVSAPRRRPIQRLLMHPDNVQPHV